METGRMSAFHFGLQSHFHGSVKSYMVRLLSQNKKWGLEGFTSFTPQ